MNTLFDMQNFPLDESNEWYTQAIHTDAARAVMDGIELDPASCAAANAFVRADRYYTQEQNGLLQDWTSRSLWLNPPFGNLNGKSNMAMWAVRLIDEYTSGRVGQAILLCMANTEALWFQPLWGYPLCFPCPRVLFHRASGKLDHHIQGTCFIYFGEHTQRFVDIFQKFGPVITPDGVHRPVLHVQQQSLWRVGA
jgi:ParB family chromosome partitioning protein